MVGVGFLHHSGRGGGSLSHADDLVYFNDLARMAELMPTPLLMLSGDPTAKSGLEHIVQDWPELPIPLMILSDSPCATSGLGRITRELAMNIYKYLPHVFRVGCIGPGAGLPFEPPFFHHRIDQISDWTVPDLPLIWRAFAQGQHGILLVIWDASRLLWLSHPEPYCPNPELKKFLLTKPFDLWTYSAIDAEGPNGKLSILLREVLRGFDRILAYSEWAARIVERTIGDGKMIESLPHGIDPKIWRPRGRDKARRKFGRLVFDTDFTIESNKFVIGIVATNQARKDYGTAIKAAAQIAKNHDVLIWIHTDVLERYWSIPALLCDYGLNNQAVVTHGQLTDEQMTWAYSACDVTFGIGLAEGYGFPIFESLACGVPCIHGNCGGAPEHMPKEMLIEPVAFRTEGTFGSQRPVYEADQWVEAALRVKGVYASLPKHLEWPQLWPRFRAWLEAGIAKEKQTLSVVGQEDRRTSIR